MNAAVRDATVAARVPLDLRADLEAIAERDQARDPDATLTTVMRRLLRRGADHELGRSPNGNGLFDPAPGQHRPGGPATSRRAAEQVAPRTGSHRHLALTYIAARDQGATADEVIAYFERQGIHIAGNGPARRVSELVKAGAIAPAIETDPETGGARIAIRPTRHGLHATVYEATALGRAWLKERST